MHDVILTTSFQQTIQRYLDREMHPAEIRTFIQHLEQDPRRQALVNREIELRSALQSRAERPKASPDFLRRLRTAIADELGQ